MRSRKRSKIAIQVKTAPTRGIKVCRMLSTRSHMRPQSRIMDALLREFSQIDRHDFNSQDGSDGIAWPSKKTLADAAGICERSFKNWAGRYKYEIMRDNVGDRWRIQHSFTEPTRYIMEPAKGDKSVWASREILSMPGLSAEAKVVHAEMSFYRNKLDRESRKRYEKVHGKGSGRWKVFVEWFSEKDFSRNQRHLAQELEKRLLLEIYREPGKPNLYRLLDWHERAVHEKAPPPKSFKLWIDWYGWGTTTATDLGREHRSIELGPEDAIEEFNFRES